MYLLWRQYFDYLKSLYAENQLGFVDHLCARGVGVGTEVVGPAPGQLLKPRR